MQWENICSLFPNSLEQWPVPHASAALPFFIRARIREAFGGVLAASDLNRKTSPQRFGIAVRPFEQGDPISTLSRSHLVKSQQLFTKIDVSQGRQCAVVLLHAYENMLFASKPGGVSKGQLALGLGAVVQETHQSLAHAFSVHAIRSPNFYEGVLPLLGLLKKAHAVYIVSDLLFDSSALHASCRQVEHFLTHLPLKKVNFFVVRDLLEVVSPENSAQGVVQMFPYGSRDEKVGNYSDALYFENLRAQLEEFTKKMEMQAHAVRLVTAQDDVNDFIHFLLHEKFGKA